MPRFLPILLAVTLATPALGQPAASEGQRLARQWCSSCHSIGPDMPPPTGDATPGFVAIAAQAATTELSLRVFLQTPHANMPNYQLSRAETDALVTYILSLRR